MTIPSLKNYVTPNTLASLYNQISNSNSQYQVLIYLEGNSDLKFYQNYFDIRKVKCVDANGKPNAKEVVKKLNQTTKRNRNKRYLALIDSDFDNILGTQPTDNIIRTDCHDLEVQIISSNQNFDKLSKLLTSYIDQDKYKKYDGKVISTIFMLSYNIGLMKLFSKVYNEQISFKEINYSYILDKNMCFEKEKLYKTFLGDNYQNFLMFIAENGYDDQDKDIKDFISLNQICNGHDIINISIFILENYLSNNKPSFKEFEQAIRIQFTKDELEKTDYCIELLSWFDKNQITKEIFTNNHYHSI